MGIFKKSWEGEFVEVEILKKWWMRITQSTPDWRGVEFHNFLFLKITIQLLRVLYWYEDRMEMNTKSVSRVCKHTVIQRKWTKHPEDFRFFSLGSGICKLRKIPSISIGDDSTLFYV